MIFFYYYKLFKIHQKSYFFIKKISKILRIIYSDEIDEENFIKLQKNINDFMCKYQLTFNKSNMKKNIHNLNHVPADVLNLGTSKFHNMFLYENFNHELNKNIFTNNFFEKSLIQKFNMELDYEDEFLYNLKDIYEKIKKKSTSGVNVKKWIFYNGSYVKIKDNENFYKINFITDIDEKVGCIDVVSKKEIFFNKKDISNLLIKSYEINDIKEYPKKIFFKEIDVSYIK